MGDCLLLTSPFRALKMQFPGFRIAVLAESRCVPCFEGNPDVSETLLAAAGKLETVRRLFWERFDAIVNLHGGPTSLVYARAARGKCYGLDSYPYSFLYSGLVPHGRGNEHTVQATLDCFRWLGVRNHERPPLYFAPNAPARRWVEGTVGEGSYVVIHPGSLFATKRWSADGFRALGRMLNDKGWKVVVTAGPGEGDFARQAACDLDPSLLLLGLTIPRLAELIRGADIYIGNDSGPMHLAAAVGTPTVAVWGSSDSGRWHPWQVPHRVVQNPFDCNPCAGYRCHVAETPLCVESVKVDQVRDAVWSLAAETGRAPEATHTRDAVQ
jgi:ADP-heptose:LPS heptosyltransferase